MTGCPGLARPATAPAPRRILRFLPGGGARILGAAPPATPAAAALPRPGADPEEGRRAGRRGWGRGGAGVTAASRPGPGVGTRRPPAAPGPGGRRLPRGGTGGPRGLGRARASRGLGNQLVCRLHTLPTSANTVRPFGDAETHFARDCWLSAFIHLNKMPPPLFLFLLW